MSKATLKPLLAPHMLQGLCVVVTGASKGIGLACAKRYAVEGCSNVHIVSRTQADLEAAKTAIEETAAPTNPSLSVHVHVLDLSKRGNVQVLFSAIDAAGQAPDILVNNAGAIPAGDLLSIEEDTWREAWDLKVFGYINMAREAYRRMKTSTEAGAPGTSTDGGGIIVNVIGTGGVRPTGGYACGATANAGLIAFTEAVGASSLKDGIRVVGVNPGPTLTPRMQDLIDQGMKGMVDLSDGWGRASTAEEIADTVVFLSSPAANHVSGTVLTVDGGRTKR